ncbi:MAG TPA: putative toxin-antitoxin system toxin component, PIN family [Mucilaginibacter sp.]|jgi:putative PIN family toxin of toxin-antitoxin system|nr:putative toxin-antitoxin system toxin component, PIN family [Mucilaginibacter sp.]
MAAKVSRIILDTNLWISFLLSKEYSKLDKLLLNNKVKLLFSEELLEDFLIVVRRPKLKRNFAYTDVRSLLSIISEVAEFVDVKSNAGIHRDTKGNFLLSLALDGNADFLITGDKDLLVLEKINDTLIMTIQEFLSLK